MEYKFTEQEILAIAAGSEESKKLMMEKYPNLFKPKFDPEKFLQDIFNRYTSVTDREKYPNIRFFGIDSHGKNLFEYDEKNNVFWLSYGKIWCILESEMKWDYQQTHRFCNGMVERHFKLKDVATEKFYSKKGVLVERHFKLKDVATMFCI